MLLLWERHTERIILRKTRTTKTMIGRYTPSDAAATLQQLNNFPMVIAPQPVLVVFILS